MIKKHKIPIIVVAAGRGNRAGSDLPKQYHTIAGKMILRHTLDSLLKIEQLGPINVIIHPDDVALYNSCVSGLELPDPIFGGTTRQESSLNGLKSISDSEYVMIHDGARPFVSSDLIDGLRMRLDTGADGVIPALAITDTIKKAHDYIIESTVDRDNLYRVQTPQAFDYKKLMKAYENPDIATLTDDASLMEAAGHHLQLSKGCERNFKITTPEDFNKAEAQIAMTLGDIRTGQGYDVHRFTKGVNLWLCGVELEHSKSLKGHSDADVAMHALTDALLSSISAGDIGTHFPPSDEQWRGAASEIFLKKACQLILGRGGMIAHMAVTIICEAPKVGPHKDIMRARLAEITNIAIDRISVQATTTEKLGFTGRGEGIAAEAIATVRLPFEG